MLIKRNKNNKKLSNKTVFLKKPIKYMQVKPFLKWAGEKTQLTKDIEKVLPKKITLKSFTL